jgi:hypothetical protein
MPDDPQPAPGETPGEDTAAAPPVITASGGLRLPLPPRKDGK